MRMLVILAVVAIAGYYVWKGVSGEDAPQSCGAVQNACIANCRKTATEAPAMQDCQDECRRNFAACSNSR